MDHTYKVVAYYRKRGRHSPAFPSLAGWTFVGLNKATPEGDKEATYCGDGSGLATLMETLHTFLQGAVEKGHVESSFTVKLFQHVGGQEDATAAAAPAAAKKKWLGLF
jgi:hypothetical protein